MPVDHSEKGFEQALENHLLTHGYVQGNPADFDPKLALDAKTLGAFLKDTQPTELERLKAIYGAEVESKVVRNDRP